MQMMEHATHDVLVLSDADIRVRPDYLRTMVRPLQQPKIGLSTCLYRARGTFGLPTVLESLLVNTDFVPMVLIADWLAIRTAYGASIAIRRAALDAIGGFAAAADQLADDYVLGHRIAAAGYELAVLPYVVETILDAVTLREVWRHQIRWARTYRTVQPLGWFMAIVTHVTTWAVLLWLVTGGAPLAQRMLLAALGARVLALGVLMIQLREGEAPLHLWLLPPKDLLVSAIWIGSWLGRDVEWSGRRFRVEPNGRLVALPARSFVSGAGPGGSVAVKVERRSTVPAGVETSSAPSPRRRGSSPAPPPVPGRPHGRLDW
jgi:ceramide glucosyltransferase